MPVSHQLSRILLLIVFLGLVAGLGLAIRWAVDWSAVNERALDVYAQLRGLLT